MATQRRITPAAPTSGGSVNFGSDGFFTGGGLGLPEGYYAVTWNVEMYQPTKQDGTPSKTPAFLSVTGTFYPLDPATGALIGEPTEHPFGCGSGAHESFLPSEDGKGFVGVPNGKSSGIWNLSNFAILFDSLKNAGLPPGLVSSSFEPIDGIWVHTKNIPEPEEKKAFAQRARAKTGAAGMMAGAQEEDRGPRTVVVVDEILENGRPWDGTGGIPEEQPAAASAKKGAVAPKKAVAPVGRKATPAPAPAEADEETVSNAAIEAISEVLSAKPNGLSTAALKVEAFSAAKKSSGDDVAQAVMETYLQDNATLGAVLEQVGYKIAGLMVKPV